MKKSLFLTLAICVIAGVSVSAQQPTFVKGDNVVSLGVGLGGYLGTGWSYTGSSAKKMPLIAASFDHCIIDNLFNEKSSIGVGGLIGFKSVKFPDWVKYNYFVFGARGTFHYALVNKLDTYGGLHLGYDYCNVKWIGHDSYNHGGASGFSYGFFVGGRYYFTDSIGAYAELGYGYAILNLGVSFKF